MAKRGSSPEKGLPSEWVRLLRLLPGYDPFKNSEGCWFDVDLARRAIEFVEECCRHIEGRVAGQPFVLSPWQRSFLANLFGWQRKDGSDGLPKRRYREALLYVPRKNGKTPFAAAIALYVFFCDQEPGQQNYIAAADREQAGKLFRQAKGMVEQEPEMASRCRIYGGRAEAGQSRSIVRASDHSFLQVVSADANSKHGGTPHLVIVDELHAQPNRELVDVLATSMASNNRRQPLTLYITTADYERPSICNEKHRYACQIRDGVIVDQAFLPAIWEADKKDDWKSPEVWRKANPNLGISVSEEYLRGEVTKAENNPELANAIKRLHLNMKTDTATAAVDMPSWDANPGLVDLAELQGKVCWGGLDLASTMDLAAFALVFPADGGGWVALVWFWAPREGARKRSRIDRVPYEAWAEQGLIKLTEGNVADYDVIREDIKKLGERFDIREIAADRWNATQLLTQLIGDGFRVVPHGQGFQSMTAPTKEFLAAVASGKLAHQGNPVLRWQAANLVVESDAADNKKPTKKKSADKIDGIVAIIMGLGRAMVEPAMTSVYDTQGLEVI